jgi:hypothetical protein
MSISIIAQHEAGSKAACFMPMFCFAYASSLKMEVIYASKMPVDSKQIIWHNIPEDRTLQRTFIFVHYFPAV